MDERGANIDLLFRNGLKDYEVLPPQEVWDKIQPVVKKNPHLIFYRSAAVVAVLIATGFLANRWSKEISSFQDNAIADLRIEQALPVRLPESGFNFINKPGNKLQPLSVTADQNNIEDLTISKTGVDYLQETVDKVNILSGDQSLKESIITRSASTNNTQKSLDIVTDVPEYYPETKPVTERWSIAAMASPTYYSRFSSGNTQMAKQLMSSEQSMVSYSGGVAVSYKINKRLSIQTGLYYSSNGQEVGGVNSFGGFRNFNTSKGASNFELFTSSGSVKTSNADVFLQAPGERVLTAYTSDVFDPEKANLQYIANSIVQNFSYLQMPFVLRYKIIDRALDFNLAGGVSYDILVNNSVYAKSGSEKYPVGITEGLNQFTVSSSLGMGMEYSFSKKISLNLEPTFRYYLNPFNEASGLKIHPYSFGIFSGFSYRF